jgi:hypothetical protein
MKAEIDRILRETITDPVGPEFNAAPPRSVAARHNTASSGCCSTILGRFVESTGSRDRSRFEFIISLRIY